MLLLEGLYVPTLYMLRLDPDYQFEVNERWQMWVLRRTSIILQCKYLTHLR